MSIAHPSRMGGYKDASSIVINGKTYPVPDNIPANTTLNDFIRNHAHLKGTKFMCMEGGCGACIVSVTSKNPDTGKMVDYAVNSCLVPLFSCHGWKVTTVEGIGNKTQGYHEIQARLAKGNGTQCGYCSTGMVMNMYSLMKNKPKLTMEEIENSFGGNLCRCTGYRPILDSFKSFAQDAPKALVDRCADIEDLTNICPVKKKPCLMNGRCNGSSCPEDTEVVDMQGFSPSRVSLQDGASWYHVNDKREIFEILDMCGDNDYMFVGGNTAHGVYRNRAPIKHFINLNNVAQLHSLVEAGGTLVLGANNSLTRTMDYFNTKSHEKPAQFGYLKGLADHIDLIANVPVRNTGTLAGNLSIKNQHKEFPSDIFVMLETVGATVVVEDAMQQERTMSLLEFRDFNMTKKLMTKIILPSLDSNQYVCRTFKITPRAQNAHAYVNAGFLFKVDKKNKYKVLEKPNIVFGGIAPGFVHASAAESEAVGKQLLSPATLKSVLGKLEAELKADHVKPDASPEYRKGLACSLFYKVFRKKCKAKGNGVICRRKVCGHSPVTVVSADLLRPEASPEYRQGLACSLFYKFVLGLAPESIDENLRSGGEILKRPVSSGQQEIATDKTIWPASKPIPKIEALAQCAGEAEYVNDLPNMPNELYGAFVLSTVGPADSFKLDASEALKLPGVVAIHTAKDIPGKNSMCNPVGMGGSEPEPVYAEKFVPCAGTCLAAIYADTHALALRAAGLVKVTYEGVKKPQIDINKILESGDVSRITPSSSKNADSVKSDVKHTIKGTFWFPAQYHFTMETQSSVSVPSEDGINVFPASQCPTQIQDAVAEALNIPRNSVNISIRRCGGGYGSKLGKSGLVATSSAIGAYLLQRPVRMVLSIESNMESIGKRAPCLFKYETGVDDNGVVQYLNIDLYQDNGCSNNDNVEWATVMHMNSIYDTTSWAIKSYSVKTDIPGNTWCRAPGSTEAIAAMENIMEHIAKEINKDPTTVKLINKKGGDIPFPALVDDTKKSSDFDKRVKDIEQFNKTNRWVKRGIALVPMDYAFGYFGNYHAMVSVFGADGTVSVSHGCVEMGQGLNTKVAQVCAYKLGVDVADVSVKPTVSIISPNNAPTGGSGGSESAVYATMKACEEILKRLEPIKKENPTATWKELVAKAVATQINLNASYMFTPNDDGKSYGIYGVTVIEVELDILTGQHQVLRVDLVEDVGISLSPEVDIGQMEGAFVMGLGLYTSEELVYSEDTGEIFTNRTWNYKIPGAKDIPIDFRVEMRKDAPNPVGVLKSKATGEPPLCMSIAVVFAMRRALEAARKDAGLPDNYFNIDLPLTAERIWSYGGASVGGFHL